VYLETGMAFVTGEDLDTEALCSAIRELGYEAQVAPEDTPASPS